MTIDLSNERTCADISADVVSNALFMSKNELIYKMTVLKSDIQSAYIDSGCEREDLKEDLELVDLLISAFGKPKF